MCDATPEPDRETALLLGRVRRGNEVPRGALVRLRWLGGSRPGFDVSARAAPERDDLPPLLWANDPFDDQWLFTTLDARGIFILCGIPTGSQVRVEVALGDDPPSVRTATLPRGAHVVTLPITLTERSQP